VKQILDLVELKKKEFAKLPFFDFIADKSIDPRKKFVWTPYAAPFLMGLKDVYSYGVFEKNVTDPIHEYINRHVLEESRHVLWYVQDLQKLGFDSRLKYTDVLNFLWGDERDRIRHLSYDLINCANQKDIVLKLATVSAIEAAGCEAFPRFLKVTDELQKITHQNYLYFGKAHASVESEQRHIHGFDEAEEYLTSIEITEDQKIASIELVESVFDIFNEFLAICLNLCEKYEDSQPFFETSDAEFLVSI
jgi:hypothetical protein